MPLPTRDKGIKKEQNIKDKKLILAKAIIISSGQLSLLRNCPTLHCNTVHTVIHKSSDFQEQTNTSDNLQRRVRWQ